MQKWEKKVSLTLQNTKPQQIWPLFKDFFNLYKYFPGLSNSYGIHGNNGEVGCIRYCEGFSIQRSKISDPEINGEKSINWSKERLIAVDDDNMSFSYEIVESNIGFNSYVSTVKISPVVGDHDNDNQGCMIEWGFSVDPIQGLRFEELVQKYTVGLQGMATIMQDSLN